MLVRYINDIKWRRGIIDMFLTLIGRGSPLPIVNKLYEVTSYKELNGITYYKLRGFPQKYLYSSKCFEVIAFTVPNNHEMVKQMSEYTQNLN